MWNKPNSLARRVAALSWLACASGSPFPPNGPNATWALETSPARPLDMLQYVTPELRRRLFGSPAEHHGILGKRDCEGQLQCTDLDVCCPLDDSCCNADVCCKPGTSCQSDGSCYSDLVVTMVETSTSWVVSTLPTTAFTTVDSTYFDTSTEYTTVTEHSQDGVATSTVWETVTEGGVARRVLTPVETGRRAARNPVPAPAPTAGSSSLQMGAVSPRRLGLRAVLEHAGLIQKRTSTAYRTIWTTLTTTSYDASTSTAYNIVTEDAVVTNTRTSVIYDGASTTVTVTSTETVHSQQRPQQPDPSPSPGSSPNDASPAPSVTITVTPSGTDTAAAGATIIFTTKTEGGSAVVFQTTAPTTPPASSAAALSTTAQIGVGVGASVGGLLVLALFALAFSRMRKNRDPRGDADASTLATHNSHTYGGAAFNMVHGSSRNSMAYVPYSVHDKATPSLSEVAMPPSSPGPGPYPAPQPRRQSYRSSGQGWGQSPVSELEERATMRTPAVQELDETGAGWAAQQQMQPDDWQGPNSWRHEMAAPQAHSTAPEVVQPGYRGTSWQ